MATETRPESAGCNLTIVDETCMTAQLDAAIRRLLCDFFPADAAIFGKERCWHGCKPEFTVVHQTPAGVLGHVGVVRRTVSCDGVEVDAFGIQSVAVSPSLRGAGIGGKLMNAAVGEAKRRGIPLGLLFCTPQLEQLYHRMGWRKVDVVVWMRDENGNRVKLTDKNIAMCLDFAGNPLPRGPLDLQGRDW